MPFKKGAFVGMKPIIPTYVKVSYLGYVSPTYDISEFWDLVTLIFSSLSITRVTIHVMPVFKPN
jgi:hypothetical protein